MTSPCLNGVCAVCRALLFVAPEEAIPTMLATWTNLDNMPRGSAPGCCDNGHSILQVGFIVRTEHYQRRDDGAWLMTPVKDHDWEIANPEDVLPGANVYYLTGEGAKSFKVRCKSCHIIANVLYSETASCPMAIPRYSPSPCTCGVYALGSGRHSVDCPMSADCPVAKTARHTSTSQAET